MKILLTLLTVIAATACGGEELNILGDPCETAKDCEDGLVCLTQFDDGKVLINGICTAECEWGDDQTLEGTCDEGEACLRYSPQDSGVEHFNCYLQCDQTDATSCREDWDCLCIDFFCSSAVCIPPL